MRLSLKELAVIKESAKKISDNKNFQLYLFGSRVDDSKKGGDIDLLFIVDEGDKEFFVDSKTKFRKLLFDSIDEQKIDITIATSTEMNTDAFLMTLQSKILLVDNLLD